MKRSAVVFALLVAFSVAFAVPGAMGQQAGLASLSPARQLDACAAPNDINGHEVAEIAWRLWVAATCPVNNAKYPFVVWEDWLEQAQMYPRDLSNGLQVPNAQAAANGAVHLVHGSPLAMVKNPGLGQIVPGQLGGADQNCNKASTPPPSQPNLVLCEEVRENGAAEDYIAGTGLWNRAAQTAAAVNAVDIAFSPPSVEIKADWIELASIGLSDCASLPPGFAQQIHVETINGNCFALAGMHLISKLKNQWIWATFEAQNLTTNPNRCRVLGCKDAFGSMPPVTHGANTALTRQLTALMTAANLAPEWFNYRLDGVQIGFSNPLLLGNSIIEGENAGVPLTQSSCITCHSVSSIKNDGTDGITLLTSNPVGQPVPLPSAAWIRRDFVWSLSEACPNSLFQTCAPPPPH